MVEIPDSLKNNIPYAFSISECLSQRESRKQNHLGLFLCFSQQVSKWWHVSYKKNIGPSPVFYRLQCWCCEAHPRSEARSQKLKRQGKKDPNSKGGGRRDKEKGTAITQVKINREPLAWTNLFYNTTCEFFWSHWPGLQETEFSSISKWAPGGKHGRQSRSIQPNNVLRITGEVKPEKLPVLQM